MEPKETPQGQRALKFANALVSGDFGHASEMLSASLRQEYAGSQLRDEYEEMIEYGDGPPDLVEVMNVLEDWPAKEPDDVGWAYVAIAGPGYSEGISVVVNREGEEELIREIEWGRP